MSMNEHCKLYCFKCDSYIAISSLSSSDRKTYEDYKSLIGELRIPFPVEEPITEHAGKPRDEEEDDENLPPEERIKRIQKKLMIAQEKERQKKDQQEKEEKEKQEQAEKDRLDQLRREEEERLAEIERERQKMLDELENERQARLKEDEEANKEREKKRKEDRDRKLKAEKDEMMKKRKQAQAELERKRKEEKDKIEREYKDKTGQLDSELNEKGEIDKEQNLKELQAKKEGYDKEYGALMEKIQRDADMKAAIIERAKKDKQDMYKKLTPDTVDTTDEKNKVEHLPISHYVPRKTTTEQYAPCLLRIRNKSSSGLMKDSERKSVLAEAQPEEPKGPSLEEIAAQVLEIADKPTPEPLPSVVEEQKEPIFDEQQLAERAGRENAERPSEPEASSLISPRVDQPRSSLGSPSKEAKGTPKKRTKLKEAPIKVRGLINNEGTSKI
jgi:DNA repair exonuclease SbcCD ATPase subunit